MATDEEFYGTIDTIQSPQHVEILAGAYAWKLLAQAATGEQTALDGISAEAAEQPGVGLMEFADRISATGGWAAGAGGAAAGIAQQLAQAGEIAQRAYWDSNILNSRYDRMREQFNEEFARADGMVLESVTNRSQTAKQEMLDEAQALRDAVGEAFAQVIGGNAPAAPGGGGAGGGAVGGGAMAGAGMAGAGAMGAASGAVGTGPMGAADVTAANGAMVGAGHYPFSSVLGPEHGDFAGWVVNPSTGFLTDPATGREFDSVSSRWIDPITGRPFGEVTEYASRLSGLGGGPGALAMTSGAAAVGTGAGMAAMYGGTVPPSIGNTGAARGQMAGQAARNMSAKAHAAQRFAAHEAGQRGGRPFVPPPAASAQHGRGVTTGQRGGAAGQARAGAGRGGTPTAAAARGFVPPPAGAAQTRGTTDATSAQRGAVTQAARGVLGSGAGRAFVPPPPAAHGARSTPGSSRAAASARHQLAGAPLPPGKTDKADAKRRKPSGSGSDRENLSIWSSRRDAPRGVLGE